jgi:hypothetical protein
VLVDDRSVPATSTPRPVPGSDGVEADPNVRRVLDCLYGDDPDERPETAVPSTAGPLRSGRGRLPRSRAAGLVDASRRSM